MKKNEESMDRPAIEIKPKRGAHINSANPKTINRQPANYFLHGSRGPIHVLRHAAYSREPAPYLYEINRRTAILDGMTVRAQRLNAWSRQLNEFTTTRRRVSSLVSGINGKTKTTGWRHSVPTAKRGSIPKSVSTLTKKGFAM
jgi:hypothetical protein